MCRRKKAKLPVQISHCSYWSFSCVKIQTRTQKYVDRTKYCATSALKLATCLKSCTETTSPVGPLVCGKQHSTKGEVKGFHQPDDPRQLPTGKESLYIHRDFTRKLDRYWNCPLLAAIVDLEIGLEFSHQPIVPFFNLAKATSRSLCRDVGTVTLYRLSGFCTYTGASDYRV
jgi:hypothetical protein